jgi:hypothetical protein
MLAINLDKLATEGEAGQLLEEKAALSAAAKAQFADQLFVGGLAPGRGGDARHEFAIGHMPRLEPANHFCACQSEWEVPGNPESNVQASRKGRRNPRFAVECGRRSIQAERNYDLFGFWPQDYCGARQDLRPALFLFFWGSSQ